MLKKTILFTFFLFLNILIYGQKKTPFLKNISSYIITESDTIKIQRRNQVESEKLREIGLNSQPFSQQLLLSVHQIEDYLNHSSRGEKPNGYDSRYDSFENLLNNLTQKANDYGLYFDLENYKKENSYYVNYPLKNGVRKSLKEIFREIDLEHEKRMKIWAVKRQNDSLLVIEKRQKEINDSIIFVKQKLLNDAREKEKRIQYAVNQSAAKKINTEKKRKQKIEAEKKQKQETKINLTIQVSGNSKQ